jgi:predicted  nucleic acid-binding Zn-ribbon protein
MVLKVLVSVLIVTAAAADLSKAKTTPTQKVMTLLKSLQTKVTDEGAREVKAYKEYESFCKEQTAEKQYSIKTSDTHIEELQAKIDDTTASKQEQDAEIVKQTKEIQNLTAVIANVSGEYSTKHAEHAKKDRGVG